MSQLNRQIVYLVSLFFSFALLTHCKTKPAVADASLEDKVRVQAQAYFNTFSMRQDWDSLLSFYATDVAFEDISLQIKLDSLWQFARFYNWPDTGFQKLSPTQEHLVVESLVIENNIAVASGHLNPFIYYGKKIDTDWGMAFTIWLYFDEKTLKIYKQQDWFEYAPDALNGVINHYEIHGVGVNPLWLDLSR